VAGASPRELVRDIALALRETVLPELGLHAGRAHAGRARTAGPAGDITFAIDELAESRLEELIAERAPRLAFYSEDRGLVAPAGEPEWVLVVDPIDGTRPALAGLESACVSVALAPLDGEPAMGDVIAGCIAEIKSGHIFLAERGSGLDPEPTPSGNRAVERMLWTYGLRGRPVRPMAEVLGDLIDASSVGGASFDLGSATFDMTRIATGQLDAYVEPGPRIVADVPGMRNEFLRVGGGAILNNSPYDLAAAVLCLEEAGITVTDAYGRSMARRPLLGSGPDFQISCVAAATPELHRAIMAELDRGIERLLAGR
jgi:myo-inositol-1(or 4)-monophosphatase